MTSGIISPLDKLRIHWVKLDFIFDIKSLGKVKRERKIHINIMQSIAICSAHIFQGLYSQSTPEMLLMQRLIKHCWAGCLLSGLYMLVYSTHVTHHPWMKNSGMQSLWLHTNVATEGSLFIWGMCYWLIDHERSLKRSGGCSFPQSDKLLHRDKQLHWIKHVCLFFNADF